MQALDTTRRLFEGLNGDVRYCHWKSNNALERSLLGEFDLDLLVAEADRAPFEWHVARLGFIRLLSTGPKCFPGLEDYLGFDEATGSLIHLHVHYRLVLGEKRIKNHHLTAERWVLAHTRMLGVVRVPNPEIELILLFIRSLLKSDARSCLRTTLGRTMHPFPRGVLEELRWLQDQCETPTVLATCRDSDLASLTPMLTSFLARLRDERLTPGYVLVSKHVLLRKLDRFRRYPMPVALSRKVWLRGRYSRPAQRLRPIPRKRLAGPGVYVGITGADGSGKTTLVHDLTTWLQWKLAAHHVYFGQPKHSRLLSMIGRGRKLVRLMEGASARARLRGAAAVLRRLESGLDIARWLHIARHRRRLDQRAVRDVAAGHVVLAERIPLRELRDMPNPMDGPRLQHTAGGRFERWARRYERALYNGLRRPDMVLLLQARLATLRGRKPETSPEEHRDKARAVGRLVESGTYDVLDVERPYERVLLDAKVRLWRELLEATQHDRGEPPTTSVSPPPSGAWLDHSTQ